MTVRINAFEVENVKRVKAVALDCSGKPLTVIGGRNAQGKTSVLDAIMWTLGGDKFRPSTPMHEGADKLRTRVELSNGIVVERKGVNGALKVTSPDGRGGQALLNEFVSAFALDLPRFMQASGTAKAKMLLDVFPGLGAELQRLNEEVKRLYGERLALGQIADRKAKHAAELPYIDGIPDAPLSGQEMAEKLKAALSANAANDAIRANIPKAEQDLKAKEYQLATVDQRITSLRRQIEDAEAERAALSSRLAVLRGGLDAAKAAADGLIDTDTKAIEAELESIDTINAKVRANSEKARAEDDAKALREQYNAMTGALDQVRADRIKLLSGVTMPLPGLAIDEEGELVYRGQRWDCMSGAEQLRVAAAICAAVKPECGFVLLDRLETMDVETLRDFSEWLDARDLQAIGTRVGTGPENSIVIEDGVSVDPSEPKINF